MKKRRLRVPKEIPLTNEDQLKKSRAEQAKTNKERANRMERRIAAFIRGKKVPQSGSAKGYKGDVEFELQNHPGKFIIECKLSANIDKGRENVISIQLKWFEKLYNDTISMGAKFGVLVIHFHLTHVDYVFIRTEDIKDLLIDRYDSSYISTLQKMLELPISIDFSINKSGRTIKAYALSRSTIESTMTSINGIPAMHVKSPTGTYIIISLAHFRDMIEEL